MAWHDGYLTISYHNILKPLHLGSSDKEPTIYVEVFSTALKKKQTTYKLFCNVMISIEKKSFHQRKQCARKFQFQRLQLIGYGGY